MFDLNDLTFTKDDLADLIAREREEEREELRRDALARMLAAAHENHAEQQAILTRRRQLRRAR
jgi:hypothetical protein